MMAPRPIRGTPMAEPSTAPVQRGPTSGVHRAVGELKPPILASEALREELAPLQPARAECRFWLLGVALALTALGLSMRFGVGVPSVRGDAATLCFSAAGAITAAAALPFPYALRAVVALVVGGALMVLGLRGSGPLAGLLIDGSLPRGVARVVTLAILPAALLFRSRYRAFPRARVVLAAALVISLPFVATAGLLVADPSAPWLARLGAGASIAWVLASCFGFMGHGTTGWGAVWAVLVLVGVPVEVALRQFFLADAATGFLTYPATAIGLVCASALASLGLFQLFASIWAPEARRRSPVGAPEPKPESSGSGIA